MRSVLRKIRKRFIGFRDDWRLKRMQRRAAKVAYAGSKEYSEYINVQIKRTLIRKNSPLQERTREFVDQISERIPLEQSTVLCVGCRNIAELEYLRSKGAQDVIGIDLQSECQDILVMDMHKMTFADDSFDLVYSSHSLEHSYDPRRVGQEFLRVLRPNGFLAIEVPIDYETGGADLVDFKSMENISALFEPHIAEVLWCERVTYAAKGEEQGPPPALRIIFRISKAEQVV